MNPWERLVITVLEHRSLKRNALQPGIGDRGMSLWELVLLASVDQALHKRWKISALILTLTALLLVFGHRFGVPWWIGAIAVVGILLYVFRPIRRGLPASPDVVVIVAATVSPFIVSFAQALGQRLATQVKVERFSRRARRARQGELQIRPPRGRGITVELEPETGEDALAALIDLDLNDPAWGGHRLRWDEAAAAWLPVPSDNDQ